MLVRILLREVCFTGQWEAAVGKENRPWYLQKSLSDQACLANNYICMLTFCTFEFALSVGIFYHQGLRFIVQLILPLAFRPM